MSRCTRQKETIRNKNLIIKLSNKVSFPGGSVVKNPPANVGDLGLIPGSGRSPGEGKGHPLQYSCLENSMAGEAGWATVHGGRQVRYD